jgi:hypothetical protein
MNAATTTADLAALAEKIRFEIDAADAAGRNRIKHAMAGGRHLITVKVLVGRRFKGWLAEHGLNRANAYNYMLLAENAESVQRAGHSSIRAALRMLRKPREPSAKSEKTPPNYEAWRAMRPQARQKFLDTISKALRQALSLTKDSGDVPSVSALAALRAINAKLVAVGMDLNNLTVKIDPTTTQRRRAA